MKLNKIIDVPQIESGSVLKIAVPTSKSITNRVLLIAALAKGKSKIINPLVSDDTSVMLQALINLGIKIEKHQDYYLIHGSSGKLKPVINKLNLNNAGTAVRFLTVAANLCSSPITISGDKRMQERPIQDLVKSLQNNNQKISYQKNKNFPPIKIDSKGILNGGTIKISGKISSQYISALLISAPYAASPITIEITDNLVSKPYIDLTLKIMQDFGIIVQNQNYKVFKIPNTTYQAQNYEIEADASSASYFYGIAAINNCKITVTNANPNSLQADTSILDILKKMGCKINSQSKKNGITVTGPSKLLPLGTIDLNHMPDAAMTVATIAACTKGSSNIINIDNLRVKETDRINALVNELKKINCEAKETKTGIKINGNSKKLIGNNIETYNDHRMAMCFAMLGSKIENMKIINPKCTEKTYPSFWNDLSNLHHESSIQYIKKTLTKIHKPIISISGMRGCGKSNNARGIAQIIDWPVVDLDIEIEKSQGIPITKIVKNNGWPYFRKIESDTLKKIIKKENIILSLGGGTIIDDENYKFLKEKSLILYLKCDIKSIAKKIQNSKKRPSLTANQNFIEELETIWQQRKEIYNTRKELEYDVSKWLPKDKMTDQYKNIILSIYDYLKKNGKR